MLTQCLTDFPAMVRADFWHKRLGYPTERVMRSPQSIPETGANFQGSLSPCETCMINNSEQQDHPKTVTSTTISEQLQPVSTDLPGLISSAALGVYRYMAEFTDHCTRFKLLHVISTKDEMLPMLCRFFQDLAMPLGLRTNRLRSDRGGEYVADCCIRYCEATDILQDFTAP